MTDVSPWRTSGRDACKLHASVAECKSVCTQGQNRARQEEQVSRPNPSDVLQRKYFVKTNREECDASLSFLQRALFTQKNSFYKMQKQSRVETHWRCQEVSHQTRGRVCLSSWPARKLNVGQRSHRGGSNRPALGRPEAGAGQWGCRGKKGPLQLFRFSPEQGADNPARSQVAVPATAPAKHVSGARQRSFCFFFFWGLLVVRIRSSGE